MPETWRGGGAGFFCGRGGPRVAIFLVPPPDRESGGEGKRGDIGGGRVIKKKKKYPPRENFRKYVFRCGDWSRKVTSAEGQWYRYATSYVSPAYALLEWLPFIQEPASGELQ